ncbi:hypothetical protein ACN3XK_41000 [Actinomadura welshii]
MSEQPGDVLDEAAKLVDALIRRVSGGGRDRDERNRDERDRDERHRGGPDEHGDVWSRATAEEPRIATGAPECRDCPICRAIAAKRAAGGDVGRHLHDAGRSLLAAALDAAAAFDRTRRNRPPRAPEASESPRAGRSERSERPEKGDAWSAATGGGPADIG